MRVPLLHADFERGSYTRIAKALRKIWPLGDLSLMQSQNTLGVLFGYNSSHDAQKDSTASFAIPDGSLSMQEIQNAVVWQMFSRYGISPMAGKDIVPKLHLSELAVAGISAEEKARRLAEEILARTASQTGADGAKKMLFLDEAGYFFGLERDGLREKLRAVEGVPNAKYLVRDGRVFVFEKLVQLVDAVGVTPNSAQLSSIALKLLDEATVSPQEAIEAWAIVPFPYEMEELAGGEFAIRHKPFDARIPGVFSSKEAAHPALIDLLIGRIVTGDGEFEYKGQGLSLRETMDLDGLTLLAPTVPSENGTTSPWLHLDLIEWRPGFSPVSESFLKKVKETEYAWQLACSNMNSISERLAGTIWSNATEFDLGRLNGTEGEVSSYEAAQLEGLRLAYPELDMLTDWTLWYMFDTYQSECMYMNSWEPNRDDDFMFYLIGQLVPSAENGHSALSVGKWTAYHWIEGNTISDAKWFASQVRFNKNLACSVAYRVAQAMRFLAQEEKQVDRRGDRISTFGDLLTTTRFRSGPPPALTVQPSLPAQK